MKYYEGNIKVESNTIFCFGSNPEGRHGLGAAKTALKRFGAKWGVGEGLQGNSYGIPTKDLRVKKHKGYRSIPPDKIINSIKKLYKCAKKNPNLNFKIAYRNTYERTLNGYSGYEMMSMFNEAGSPPDNIFFSKEWYDSGWLTN